MAELYFIEKPLTNYINTTEYNKVTLLKPQTCPHCSVNTDAHYVQQSKTSDFDTSGTELITFIWRCTACKKIFVSFHGYKNKQCTYLDRFPKISTQFNDPEIEKISPRFIEMYNQALHAEDDGGYNLAAVGFRSALEILIKDYAVICLGKSKDDVSSKKLIGAITEYLGESDLIKTADVVRILGNDHTHYERKYPEYDFNLLKSYMNIFISQIRTYIMIKYPPVSRQE